MECSGTKHWCHVSIFLLTKVITKINKILHMQFPFLPEGVKWKVVKDVHCPPLLIDTGLVSIGPFNKKLLQKHRPQSRHLRFGKARLRHLRRKYRCASTLRCVVVIAMKLLTVCNFVF